jgi:hypothetical protein
MKQKVKPYSPSDIHWLMPIAEKYGETNGMLTALSTRRCAMVTDHGAVMAIFPDEHGDCLAGLCNDAKKMLPIVPEILAWADAQSIRLHGHWAEGSWQAKLALQNGFYCDLGTYYRPASAKISH